MAYLYAPYHDRIKVNSTDTGTGALTIDSTEAGYLPLPDAEFYYVIEHENGTEWEVGYGDGVTPGELSRSTVIASSNSNALVNFSSGAKRIFTTVPAQFLNAMVDTAYYRRDRPSGEGQAFTYDDTTTSMSVGLSSPLNQSGGLSYMVASYTVVAVAQGPNHRKAWDGKIVVMDDVIQSNTQTVIADPNARSWSLTVHWNPGIDFEVTGEAGVTISWRIKLDVLDHDENGV